VVRRVEQIMGTAISLEIADPLPPAVTDGLADDVFAWMREVDERFSTYKETSEISRIDAGTLPPAEASTPVGDVLAICADLWRETDGYFDVYATGGLDPSGYVKGWAVQVASDRLLAAGASNHCLNAGGDVRVRGHARPGEPWRVGVRHPFDAHSLCFVLAATDLAIATSGTYERGRHVVDPRRRLPAAGLRSVTVTGPDLGRADAFATAAVAMGEAGLSWLAGLDGYESGVVTDDGRCYRSGCLQEA
jgi:thiamine biosynthesis lipoprotein